jgi:hypothetical protein
MQQLITDAIEENAHPDLEVVKASSAANVVTFSAMNGVKVVAQLHVNFQTEYLTYQIAVGGRPVKWGNGAYTRYTDAAAIEELTIAFSAF